MPKINAAAAFAAYETALADRRRDASEQHRAATAGDVEHGTVSWYDPVRGAGFIAADAGSDVFLGGRVAEAAGVDPWPGDRLEFEREAADHGATDVALRPRLIAAAPRELGQVKFYGPGHSGDHGFIRADRDGESVFVNAKILAANAIASLAAGDRVEFFRAPGNPRAFAQRIRLLT